MRRTVYAMAVLTAGLGAGGAHAEEPASGQQVAWVAARPLASPLDSGRMAIPDVVIGNRADGPPGRYGILPAGRSDGAGALLVDLDMPLPADAGNAPVGDGYVGGYVHADGGGDPVGPDLEMGGFESLPYGAATPTDIDIVTPDADFPELNEALGVPDTLFALAAETDKVTIFTPRVAGARIGIMYTPEVCASLLCGDRAPGDLGPVDEFGPEADVLELGLNYAAELSGVDIAVHGAYGRGDPMRAQPLNGFEEQDQWDLGFSLGYGSWLVAGRYRYEDQGLAFDNLAREAWRVGLQYQPGAWRWGVQYLNSRPEASAPDGQTADAVEIGGAYDIAPGLLLTGGLQLWDVQNPFAETSSEGEAVIVILGTAITF